MNKKQKWAIYLLTIIVVLLMFIIGIYTEEERYFNKKEKWRDLRFDESLNILIGSAFRDEAWFIINDSLSFYAKQKNSKNNRFLSDYLRRGDRLYKRANNDTLLILRGRKLEEFVIIRADPKSKLSPKQMIKLLF